MFVILMYQIWRFHDIAVSYTIQQKKIFFIFREGFITLAEFYKWVYNIGTCIIGCG